MSTADLFKSMIARKLHRKGEFMCNSLQHALHTGAVFDGDIAACDRVLLEIRSFIDSIDHEANRAYSRMNCCSLSGVLFNAMLKADKGSPNPILHKKNEFGDLVRSSSYNAGWDSLLFAYDLALNIYLDWDNRHGVFRAAMEQFKTNTFDTTPFKVAK